MKLDRYFRALSWWTDRLGMALGYLWEGLSASHLPQSYFSLIALIESLVGTRQTNSHALAERVATMLGTDTVSRQAEYDNVLRLYKVRNRLVHGSAHPRKGSQTTQSLYMGATWSNVPQDDLASAVSVGVRTIRRCLDDQEYLSVVEAKGNESSIDERLDTMFMRRLLTVP